MELTLLLPRLALRGRRGAKDLAQRTHNRVVHNAVKQNLRELRIFNCLEGDDTVVQAEGGDAVEQRLRATVKHPLGARLLREQRCQRAQQTKTRGERNVGAEERVHTQPPSGRISNVAPFLPRDRVIAQKADGIGVDYTAVVPGCHDPVKITGE
jgi:hypothetical protein